MEPPHAVATAWQGVTEQWDDPARHERLLAAAAQYSCYAWVAARYKERAGDPIATQQLQKLRRATTAAMTATATVRSKGKSQPYRSTVIILVSLVLMAILALIFLKLIQLVDSR